MPGEPERFGPPVTNGIHAGERRRRLSSSSSTDGRFVRNKKQKPPLRATQRIGETCPARDPFLNHTRVDQLDSDLKDNDTSTNPPSLGDGTSRESSTPNTPKSVAYFPTTTYGENPEDLLLGVRPNGQVAEPVASRQCGIHRYTSGEHNRQSMPHDRTVRRLCRFTSGVNSPLRTVDLFTSCDGMGHSATGQHPVSLGANADATSNEASGVSSSHLLATPATGMGNRNPSSEDSESSSHNSSTSHANHCDDELEDDGGLKSLIKKHTAGPKVAKELYEKVCGILEYAPQQSICSLKSIEKLSLLDALELDTCYNACTNSDDPGSRPSSSSSTFSAASGSYPSPNKHASGPGNGSNGIANDNVTEITELTEVIAAETRSRSGKAQFQFRCPHHAYLPDLFRVNHGTSTRYRSCMGPGWNSIHHLRGHMTSHHRVKAKRKNTFQCSDCQEAFEGKTELKAHRENVTCHILCSECQQEFSCREMRKTHYSEVHAQQADQSPFREIDDDLEAKVKKHLKTYADGLKKGKKLNDDERERWIGANTEKYMSGRDDNANPMLELGQWYIIFTTLFPQIKVPEPFYAYDQGIPNSEYVLERILFLFDQGVESHVKHHGLPESTHEATKGFYSDILRQSLNIAANTRLLAGSSGDSRSGWLQDSPKALDQYSLPPQIGTVAAMSVEPTSQSTQLQQHEIPPTRIQTELELVQNDGFGSQLVMFIDESQTFLDGSPVLLDGDFNEMDFVSLGNENDLVDNHDLNGDHPFA